MQALNGLGKVENVSVRRDDRPNSQTDEANAPADVSIQVYSQGNIVSEETGIWVTPTFNGRDTSNTQRIGGRADVIGEWRLPESERTLHRWFNTSAFAIPQNGTFGNAGPNSIDGPGRWGQDLGYTQEGRGRWHCPPSHCRWNLHPSPRHHPSRPL